MHSKSDFDMIIHDLRMQREALQQQQSTVGGRAGEIDVIIEKLTELRDRARVVTGPSQPPESDEPL
jgi:hypothetical protein